MSTRSADRRAYSRRGFLRGLVGASLSEPDRALLTRAGVTHDMPILTASSDIYGMLPPTTAFVIPQIARDAWRFTLNGMVTAPFTWDYAQLLALPAVDDVRMFESANNPVGGALIANVQVRGARLADLVRPDSVAPGATHARLESADGYTTGVTLEQLMHADTLLVYAVNDEPLTSAQGGPVRLHIPGLYDYKMPRWLTRMRITNAHFPGYWETRGWSQSGVVRTHAIIRTPDHEVRAGEPVAIQGVAVAGLRSVVSVELQIDGGEWMPASLTSGGASLAWTQWYLIWTFAAPGVYEIAARAADDSGFVQIREGGDPFPNGADGIHRVVVRVS